MNRAALMLGVGAAVALAYWYTRRGPASGASGGEAGGFFNMAAESLGGLALKLDRSFNSFAWSNMRKLKPQIEVVRYEKNVIAFLAVIRHKESNHTDAAYRLMNGGQSFMAPPWVHPGRVFRGGTSTAAGAFQFVKKTWQGIVDEVGLTDFSPPNQERAAIYHMAYLGALPYVLSGDFELAIDRCNNTSGWTSLPGGPEQLQTMAEAKRVYLAYGGRLRA